MSNRGYGMFMHTSAPVTCDFGATNINVNKLFMGMRQWTFRFLRRTERYSE